MERPSPAEAGSHALFRFVSDNMDCWYLPASQQPHYHNQSYEAVTREDHFDKCEDLGQTVTNCLYWYWHSFHEQSRGSICPRTAFQDREERELLGHLQKFLQQYDEASHLQLHADKEAELLQTSQ
eukprot:scpid44003/ scgid21104/ 